MHKNPFFSKKPKEFKLLYLCYYTKGIYEAMSIFFKIYLNEDYLCIPTLQSY